MIDPRACGGVAFGGSLVEDHGQEKPVTPAITLIATRHTEEYNPGDIAVQEPTRVRE